MFVKSAFTFIMFFSFVWIASAQEEGFDPAEAKAKAVALRAVSSMLLEPDVETLSACTDSKAEFKDQGPGSGLKMAEELAKVGAERIQRIVSVREIIFFTAEELPAIKSRFSSPVELDESNPASLKMWDDDRVPAHMKKGMGCLVVWDEFDVEDHERHWNVFVLKKVKGKHKIVYLDKWEVPAVRK